MAVRLRALRRRHRPTRAPLPRGDAGMVSAETAMVLPVLVLLSMVGVAAIGVAQARVGCADAAREAARSVARGGAPPGGGRITISVANQADRVRATAVERIQPLSWLPGITITEAATAAAEPGAAR